MEKIELLRKREREFFRERKTNTVPEMGVILTRLIVALLENGTIDEEDIEYLERG